MNELVREMREESGNVREEGGYKCKLKRVCWGFRESSMAKISEWVWS